MYPFYKYNLDVTYCCSGAIVAAVCDDFRSFVFSLVVVKSVCLLSIVCLTAVLCLIGEWRINVTIFFAFSSGECSPCPWDCGYSDTVWFKY